MATADLLSDGLFADVLFADVNEGSVTVDNWWLVRRPATRTGRRRAISAAAGAPCLSPRRCHNGPAGRRGRDGSSSVTDSCATALSRPDCFVMGP